MKKTNKQISPARGWAFTLHNWTEEEHSSIVQRIEASGKFQYLIGKEHGKEESPHLQGCIQSIDKEYKWRPLPMFSVKRDGVECTRFSKFDKPWQAQLWYCSKEFNWVSNIRDVKCHPMKHKKKGMPWYKKKFDFCYILYEMPRGKEGTRMWCAWDAMWDHNMPVENWDYVKLLGDDPKTEWKRDKRRWLEKMDKAGMIDWSDTSSKPNDWEVTPPALGGGAVAPE